jgi:FXSXX-COOH protein
MHEGPDRQQPAHDTTTGTRGPAAYDPAAGDPAGRDRTASGPAAGERTERDAAVPDVPAVPDVYDPAVPDPVVPDPAVPGAVGGSGGPGGDGDYGSALGGAGIDLLGMDLEALRTTEHPVLSALVDELRERIAAPEGVALWAFNNAG